MSRTPDARIPIRLLDSATAPAGAVVLAEDGAPLPATPARVERFATPVPGAHPIGCACCQPRGPAAIALDRLFLARTRGAAPWFTELVAVTRTEAGRESILAAARQDRVTASRFRIARAPEDATG